MILLPRFAWRWRTGLVLGKLELEPYGTLRLNPHWWSTALVMSESMPMMLGAVRPRHRDYVVWLHRGQLVLTTRLETSVDVQTVTVPEKSLKMRKRRTRYIPQHVRLKVALRDRGRCVYCGEDDLERLEIDHLRAYSKGGRSDDVTNLALACKRCNRSKGARDWGWG